MSWLSQRRLEFLSRLWFPTFTFLLVSLVLTFNILSLPNAVIGDNFAWTRPNIVDILGPAVIRESYMGDVAVLSTFRTGFLYPLSLVLTSQNLPMTLVYPFLFYFLSMLSFYALASEFLRKQIYRVILSIIFVVNPVTPYYSASIMSAFVIVFLPLTLKFFIRAVREMHKRPVSSKHFSSNLAFSSLFLALAISAHEQFLPSAGIIAFFLIVTFMIECYKKFGLTSAFAKTAATNVLAFTVIGLLVNVPLLTSAVNIMRAPFATYFTARFHDFLTNVRFTYSTSNLVTLLRFGGDSGTGLAQNAWFDSTAPSNLFGYAPFICLAASVALLILHTNETPWRRRFFTMNLLMFAVALGLIFFVQYLPNNAVLAERLLSLPLQSWENPSKLRVLLLLSGLTASLFAFQRLEEYGKTRKRKIVSGTLLTILVASVIIYNSPWIVGYFGFTPLKQVSDSLNWGSLYDKQYADLSTLLENNLGYARGVIIPYSRKSELYVPPNFRLFQLVSEVDEKMNTMTLVSSVSWSKVLGFLSTKYVLSDNDFDPQETLLFPKSLDGNLTRIIDELNEDNGLKEKDRFGNFTVYENENALPQAYASRYYVLYDETRTSKYAFDVVDFRNLPVFISSAEQIGQLVVPQFVEKANYQVYALMQSDISSSNSQLTITSIGGSRLLNMSKVTTSDVADWFSAKTELVAGDVIEAADSGSPATVKSVGELTLNSTSYPLGNCTSFTLKFKVNIIERGQYSVQGPRVIIEAGNSTRYFVMFHTNGVIELGIWRDGSFTSGVMIQQGSYDLSSEQNAIDVEISKVFDDVRVSVNGDLELLFPLEAKTSAVSVSSDSSISRFTDIELTTRNITRIFAVRQLNSQPIFTVEKCDAGEAIIEIQDNSSSNYAVVVQYLNNPLRAIENNVKANAFRANLFFNGWIVNPENAASNIVLTIGIANFELSLGLVTFSILFTWSALILGTAILNRKKPVHLSIPLTRVKRLIAQVLRRREPIG